MEVAFLVIYAVILGLVTPYVVGKSEQYGVLVPTTIGLSVGSVLWVILTWIGMKQTEAWIWIIVMLAMPVALWFGARFLRKRRDKVDAETLHTIKHGAVAKPNQTAKPAEPALEAAAE